MAERRLLAQRKAAAQPAGLVFGISSASTKTASIRAPRQQLVITSAVSRRQAVYYRVRCSPGCYTALYWSCVVSEHICSTVLYNAAQQT